MKKLIVETSSTKNICPIFLGRGILKDQLKELVGDSRYTSVFLIVDANAQRFQAKNIDALDPKFKKIIVKSGEKSKSLSSAQDILSEILAHGGDRKSLVVNIGGGVVGDLGGFVASIYMRGIDFVQVPTTLLSMVDSSVGGKVGINFGGVKNVIGSFMAPITVIMDTHFLDSLPAREVRGGFAEMVKHGFIRSRAHLDDLKKVTKEIRDGKIPKEIEKLIFDSISIKKSVVVEDPKESGVRKILNFGHTVGHAIESVTQKSQKKLHHGEAVALGMLAESHISDAIGLSKNMQIEVKEILECSGLPVSLSLTKSEITEAMQTMKRDKKNIGSKILLSICDKIGSCKYGIEVEQKVLLKGLKFLSSN